MAQPFSLMRFVKRHMHLKKPPASKNTSKSSASNSPLEELVHVPVPTFGKIPRDIAFEIIDKLTSFHDLKVLILSSSICYNIFIAYQTSISTRIAKIILEDAWDDATAILVYQRNTNAEGYINDFAVLKKDLRRKFVFLKSDISRLLANQKFYHSCVDDFSTFLGMHFASSARPRHRISTFGRDSILPMKIFYEIWLLALRYHYEDVSSFAKCAVHTHDQIANYRFAVQIISRNRLFKKAIKLPVWEYKVYERAVLKNLFEEWTVSVLRGIGSVHGLDRSLFKVKLNSAIQSLAEIRKFESSGGALGPSTRRAIRFNGICCRQAFLKHTAEYEARMVHLENLMKLNAKQ